MTFRVRFAENLIGLRKLAGLSQEGLAIRASLSRDAIRKYERQVNVPTLDVVVRLGGALSVPPAELLDGIAYRPSFIGMGEGRYEIDGAPSSDEQTRGE
jgi:transcriptional regulator with XRE-family HTH domain